MLDYLRQSQHAPSHSQRYYQELHMTHTATYDRIGQTYDTTRKADRIIVDQIMNHLRVVSNGKYLDVGCGSGNYTGALATKNLNIEGFDISESMLQKARKKYPNVSFMQGNALHLPHSDATFDGAICTLATHHIDNNPQLFQEVFRVLNQGYFVMFTATPEQMQSYWLHHYFPKMMKSSAEKMASFESIEYDMKQAGFQNIQSKPFFISNELQDWFLHAGKYRPEIYLDAAVRNGISSFHLSSCELELQQGLQELSKDIKNWFFLLVF
jgi:ubiquinone/menaquinone biosynthesis C-methylase UbiE